MSVVDDFDFVFYQFILSYFFFLTEGKHHRGPRNDNEVGLVCPFGGVVRVEAVF